MSASELFTSSLLSYFDGIDNHTTFRIFSQTKALFPSKQHVFVEDASFDLRGFLESEGYPPTVYEGQDGGFKQTISEFASFGHDECTVKDVLQDGVFEFEYKGTQFQVFTTTWTSSSSGLNRVFHFVFDGPDRTAGKVLVKAVHDCKGGLKDQIWVFNQGTWTKDGALFTAIQTAEWDDLVLDEDILNQLKTDTTTFFASQDIYKSLNTSWKRGLLLLGPPGNGKTQTIQLLLKDCIKAGIACLYVKSFQSRFGAEFGIRSIFEMARARPPCILILEDLDAMVTDDLRSFFLNEMDGLEKNDGILTVASTNHPEKIDDAILKRPSRFDQKYTFSLPTSALRERYATKWIGKIKQLGSVDFGDIPDKELGKEISEKTADWSFAFLKELFVSFLLQSASERSLRRGRTENGFVHTKTDVEALMEQVKLLGEQVGKDLLGDQPVVTGIGGFRFA